MWFLIEWCVYAHQTDSMFFATGSHNQWWLWELCSTTTASKWFIHLLHVLNFKSINGSYSTYQVQQKPLISPFYSVFINRFGKQAHLWLRSTTGPWRNSSDGSIHSSHSSMQQILYYLFQGCILDLIVLQEKLQYLTWKVWRDVYWLDFLGGNVSLSHLCLH